MVEILGTVLLMMLPAMTIRVEWRHLDIGMWCNLTFTTVHEVHYAKLNESNSSSMGGA